MQKTGTRLFLRAAVTWMVLLLFLLSCTAQPPVLKHTSAISTGSQQRTQRAWLPQETAYFTGKPTPEAQDKLGFRIQDYAKSTSCVPDTAGCISTLNANLAWSAPSWQPQGDTITLAALKNPAAISYYGYYFSVLETQTNAQGQTYAARVRADVMIQYTTVSTNGIPYQRDTAIQSLLFVSADGLNFSMDPSPNQGALKYNWNNPVQNGFCAAGGWGEGGNLTPSQARLVLNPISKTAQLSASFSGPIIYSYYNQEIPENPYSCRLISNQTGTGSVELNTTFHVDFQEQDTLSISASPAKIVPNGAPQQTTLQIRPSNPTRPWRAIVTSTDPSTCKAVSENLGTYVDAQEISWGHADLADGPYVVDAEYIDDALETYSAKATVEVENLFGLQAEPAQIGAEGSARLLVEAPPCPAWEVSLKAGGRQKPLFPDSPEIVCQAKLLGSGSKNGEVSWDGTCTGVDPSTGQTRSARVAAGSYLFELKAGERVATATVEVLPEGVPTPTPTPCPAGENCPTPPGPSCPPGQVCPPGGTPTPPPPDPTPTLPPPPDPPTGPPPPPPVCPGPLCPPPPGPPAPPRTPDPRPSQKPPTPPTPTAPPGGAFCPAGTDAETVQESGFQLMAQTPETFADTRELNQSLKDWNQLQNQLNPGFSIASNKAQRDERLQAKLAETEQRFQTLYWNVRDELGYLEPLRRQLASVLQKQAGSLPNVTLSSNLVAQAENYDQQFKAQKGDLDGLEALKMLYSELQTYLWVTQLFIEQNQDSAEVVEALRKLKGQIVNHSDYLAQEYKLFETGDPAEIAAENQEIDSLIAELETAIAELGGDFQIQALSINEIKLKATQLANQLKALKLSKNTAQRINVLKNSRNFMIKELMSRSSRMTADFVGGGKTKLLNALIKILRAGLKIESFRRTIQEISCDEAVSIKRKFDDFNRLMVLIEKAAQAIATKITSNECVENGEPKVLQAAIEKLLLLGNEQTGSLKVINDKANATFRLLDKDNDVGPGSAFQKSLDELILLAAHLSQNLGLQLDALIEACEDKCGDEIKSLTDYYNAMPENIAIPNPNPTAHPNTPNDNKAKFRSIQSNREKQYAQILPSNIKFMYHPLGKHGGTVDIQNFLLLEPSSKFYTDKSLFYYALEAYKEHKKGKSNGVIFVGSDIGFSSYFNGSVMDYRNVQNYKYVFINKCALKTIYPQ